MGNSNTTANHEPIRGYIICYRTSNGDIYNRPGEKFICSKSDLDKPICEKIKYVKTLSSIFSRINSYEIQFLDNTVIYEVDVFENINGYYSTNLKLVRECTEVVVADLLNEYPMIIRCTPDKWLTEELITTFLERNGLNIQYFPERLLTKEMIFKAVSQNGDALRYIRKKDRTIELIMEAIKTDICAMRDLPEEKITQDMITRAVEYDSFFAMKFIPEDKLTEKIVLEAVKRSPMVLGIIPEKFRTHEVIMKSVTAYGPCVSLLTNEEKTKEVIAAAFKQMREHPRIMAKIHDHLTDEQIEEECKLNPSVIKHIPTRLLNEELIMEGIRENIYFINRVPECMQTKEMLELADQLA